MQTILGAGGAIGTALAKSLTEYTTKIRLVSRNPEAIHETDELVSADLMNYEETLKAVEGSEVVYLTIGLPYSYKAWKELWPKVMRNTIDACKAHKAKLVFVDNIYMYDCEELGNMREDAKINPCSKKGEVRKEILEMILQEVEAGTLTALIARCADYYGPGIKNTSMLTETVFNKLANNEKTNWLGPLHFKHSFTYVPDAGKGTAILGNTPDAFNQTWHLPTAANPLSGQELTDAIAKEMGKTAKTMVLTRFIAGIMGLFMPLMKELKEMMYQYDRDYVFNSEKFDKRFNFTPTSYQAGIAEVAKDYAES